MTIEWDEIDVVAEAEGWALKRAFKIKRPQKARGPSNRSPLARDYRYSPKRRRGPGILELLNVIDGRPT